MSKLSLRIGLVLSLTTLSLFGFGQSDWIVIQLEKLSFAFPSDYTQTDTLGQTIYVARTAVGSIQFAKVPQPLTWIKNEKELLDVYTSFQDKTIEQLAGRVVSESAITIDKHHARRFQFETKLNDTAEAHECIIVHLYGTIYSFTYSHLKKETSNAMKEKYAFFNGININDTDQYEKTGEFVGLILRYIMIAFILLAIGLWFLRKYHAVGIIKNIFSWAFLVWGSICILLYIGNLAYDVSLPKFLIIGIILVFLGYFLRKVKVPTQIS